MAEAQPIVTNIRREDGAGGQVAYHVTVEYDGIPFRTMFTGHTYGTPGPVVMLSGDPAHPTQTFVTDPARYGQVLDRNWVLRFYAQDGVADLPRSS